jgi:acyl carrier protein
VDEMSFDRFRRCISETLEIGVERLARETQFENDLAATSLDVIDVILSLEREFEVDIFDSDLDSIRTVGDAFDLLESKL